MVIFCRFTPASNARVRARYVEDNETFDCTDFALSTATSGRAREYRVRDHLVSKGWSAIMRAAASKGAADLLMAHPVRGAALVQVGTPTKTLGPSDRLRFTTAADLCGALCILATADRRGIRYQQVTIGLPATWETWTP